MSKPRLFIGSASESLDVAYAAQEALEHDAEVTVWTQGIFDLSKYTLDALVDTLETVDFAMFILSPVDVVVMRDETKRAARDNVIFELGMFVGRLGRERSFIVIPRAASDLHLPTDLLGITPGLYDADRTDGNLVAALGPAANKARKSIKALGPIEPIQVQEPLIDGPTKPDGLVDAKVDCLALIEAWMGHRPSADNTKAMRYAEVDRELGLKPGSAKKYIAEAARRWDYSPRHEGEEVITFQRGTNSW